MENSTSRQTSGILGNDKFWTYIQNLHAGTRHVNPLFSRILWMRWQARHRYVQTVSNRGGDVGKQTISLFQRSNQQDQDVRCKNASNPRSADSNRGTYSKRRKEKHAREYRALQQPIQPELNFVNYSAWGRKTQVTKNSVAVTSTLNWKVPQLENGPDDSVGVA